LNASRQRVEEWNGIKTKEDFDKHFFVWLKLADPEYVVTPENTDMVKKMLIYFSGSKLAEQYGLSLNKGLFICGDFGVGKTWLFKFTHRYLAELYNPNIYRNTSVEEILTTIRRNSDDSNIYTFNSKENTFGVKKQSPINICINEFAVSYDMKIYGTEADVLMESFYMKRYEVFQNFNKLTHATCNYDLLTLQKNFPEKIVDRFKEMFNFVELKGKSYRK
jgi:DNA replication protein DnaC